MAYATVNETSKLFNALNWIAENLDEIKILLAKLLKVAEQKET